MPQPTEEEYIAHLRKLNARVVDGYVKLKLVHSEGTSLVVPDLLAVDLEGMCWFQPMFFYGCRLSFLTKFETASLGIELCNGALVDVTLTSGGFVAALADSSQVFRCLISHLPGPPLVADGTCSLEADGDFLLNLFHHTGKEAFQAIHASGHFRGSRWNVQGTRELKNVEYAYFTSLQKVASEEDLAKIAMASTGRIYLRPTNPLPGLEIGFIEVTRQSTLDRTETIPVSVPASLAASQHVYRHAPKNEAVHYELCSPYIYRVGLQPGKVAPFQNGRVAVQESDRKRFDYVVLGDAGTAQGLVAPFDEEETRSLFHIERCSKQTFLEFWRSHANSDQVSWRVPGMLEFKDGNSKAKG